MLVSANLDRSGNVTTLIKNAQLPSADAINLVSGRLIMNYGDSFAVSGNVNSSGQLVLSLLETSTG